MIIYKITNKQNGKMYIGQTINSLENRWKRHQSDALNNIIDTHFIKYKLILIILLKNLNFF